MKRRLSGETRSRQTFSKDFALRHSKDGFAGYQASGVFGKVGDGAGSLGWLRAASIASLVWDRRAGIRSFKNNKKKD